MSEEIETAWKLERRTDRCYCQRCVAAKTLFKCAICEISLQRDDMSESEINNQSRRNVYCDRCWCPPCTTAGCKTCRQCHNPECKKKNGCKKARHRLSWNAMPRSLEEQEHFRCDGCKNVSVTLSSIRHMLNIKFTICSLTLFR